MHDPQINIQDIECPTLRGQVKALIEDIIDLCPSDSTVKATVTKFHGRFLAEFKVASQSVMMQAADQASVVTDLMEHIKSKMQIQIIDWRNHRFAT